MKRILFLLSLLLGTSLALYAQSYDAPQVVVSTEKASIGGKVYLLHKVMARQTVYSICKAYGVTEQELATANPDLKDGLKAGSILFVPAKGAQAQAAPAADSVRTTVPEADKPNLQDKVPEGLIVERVIEHRVRWYESLNSIARKYGITAAELLSYNGLDESESIRGKVLLIPVLGEEKPQDDTGETDGDDSRTPSQASADSSAADTHTVTPIRKMRWYTAQDPIRIALVLPLNASGSKASSSFLNFYSGALMAIQEQKEKGAHVIVNVYDLAQGTDAILSDPKFTGSDLIVGPVEAPTLEPFLTFSDLNGTMLVSPLDHKADSLVDTHPFLFQAPASSRIQIQNLVESLVDRTHTPVILLTSHSTGETKLVGQIENELQKNGVSYRKATLSEVGSMVSGASALNPARILIGSENKTFASEAIRSLNAMTKRNVHLQVWCTNRVRNFETSDPDALFNLSVHTSAPYFVDYSNPEDRSFVLRYRALFYADPDDFAFQGHDLLTFFIASMMRQGSAFIDHADLHPMQLLHCNFHFVRENAESGWRNHATRNLVYDKDDFAIVLTK